MRKAIVHYDTEDSADVQQTALLMGLESVLYELLETHGWLADDLRERCADVIDEAAETLAEEDELLDEGNEERRDIADVLKKASERPFDA
jgi:6-phosphogluconate dehydrogenase (decarboxylating)